MNDDNKLFLADFKELALEECGREKCKKGKLIDNDVKSYHLFHYVLYGSGTFITNKKTYFLKKGDIFYIPPGQSSQYFPSSDNPWIYTWIGFSGSRSEEYLKKIGLSLNEPIYHDTKNLQLKPMFNDLADKYNHSKFLSIECLAVFINIIYKMMISEHKEEIILSENQSYIRSAKTFIENNFQFKIKITDIADSLSISPNYLSNVFKDGVGISPKQYLTEYRMQKACQILSNGNTAIKDVALSVGYSNSLHFSAEFKRVKLMSPSEYKNKNKIVEV